MWITIDWLWILVTIIIGVGLLKLTLQFSNSCPVWMGISSIVLSAVCFFVQTLVNKELVVAELHNEFFWRQGITLGLLYAFAFLFSSLSAIILFDRQKKIDNSKKKSDEDQHYLFR